MRADRISTRRRPVPVMSQSRDGVAQREPDIILRHSLLFTIVLCALWIFPGLIGRDPWKPDEAYSFGLVYHILQTGDWVVPTLAGEPFVENPPIFFLTAAFFAHIFQAWLPLHDGARMATAFYMALTFLVVGLSARELYSAGKGWLAVLVLMGCIGLVDRGHLMITDIAQLAGFALAIYGLVVCLRRPVLGGLWLGTGVGLGFLSKGLLAPGCLGIIALALPAISPPWRTGRYLGTLAVALVASLPWLLIWPIALYQRSPELFHDWFWVNNFGRFVGSLSPEGKPGYYFAVLPWYAFPAWPLAAWALWQGRGRIRTDPGLTLPLTAIVVIVSVLSLSADARELYAKPVLVPFALLAVPGLLSLRRGAANGFWWFCILFFACLMLVGWFWWSALDLGIPRPAHNTLMRQYPGYHPEFDPFKFTLSVAYTGMFIWVLVRLRRSAERPLVAWVAGVTMTWGLFTLFFWEGADTRNSYRAVVTEVARQLPAGYRCLSSRNLGEPQRALFDYIAGIVTYREEVPERKRDCDVLLVQGFRANMFQPGDEWIKYWEGTRPGDRRELFRLYRHR
jgi:4-amino-4-deoxy-L-arabinose transferase-like glycosyltransferase